MTNAFFYVLLENGVSIVNSDGPFPDEDTRTDALRDFLQDFSVDETEHSCVLLAWAGGALEVDLMSGDELRELRGDEDEEWEEDEDGE